MRRLRAGFANRRSGGPGQPSARTMTGCLQWLDARDTKGGGSRLDGEARKAFPMRPRGSTVYGDRKAAGGAPRGAARSPMSARTKEIRRAAWRHTLVLRGKWKETERQALPGPRQKTGAITHVPRWLFENRIGETRAAKCRAAPQSLPPPRSAPAGRRQPRFPPAAAWRGSPGRCAAARSGVPPAWSTSI